MSSNFSRFSWPKKYINNRRRNCTNGESDTNKSEAKQNEIKPIIIHVPESNTSDTVIEQRTANFLTKISITVNAILLVLTLGALFFTYKSVKVAQDSLDYARVKDYHQSALDSVERISYIEVVPDIEVFKVNQNTRYNIKINDFGAQTLKIDSSVADCKFFFKYLFDIYKPETVLNNLLFGKDAHTNKYLTRFEPLRLDYHLKHPMTTEQDSLFKAKINGLFMFGLIKYKNTVSGKKYIYKFVSELLPPIDPKAKDAVWNYSLKYNENFLDTQ